ncbi:MAG: DUF4129 domain-containing protein [Planctomycetes bacterium]|nr:DUF4129 domain-containing protein [Planctomycetota bacterium]
MPPRIMISALAFLLLAGPVLAQADGRDYARLPIDPDFKKILENRLQMERDLGPLKDLIKKIVADPSKFAVTKDQLKDLKLDDPNFQKALKAWAGNDPQIKGALKEWVKNPPADQPEKVKELQQNLKKFIDEEAKPDPKIKNQIEPPKLSDLPTAKVDPIAKASENAMKQAENSRLGDWLRDSPAWNKAVKDLQDSMANPNAPQFDWAAWKDKLQGGKAWKLGEGVIDRFGEMPRPEFGGVRPEFGLPRIQAPQLPDFSGPSLPTLSVGVVWLMLFVLFVLTAWLILRWTQPKAPADDDETMLGPWPVRPENVATRTELIQAFDYLAVLTLGREVQSWNHQAVARHWQERAPQCMPETAALADLYEQARYTEGADELSEPQRDQARRSLVRLAEALA